MVQIDLFSQKEQGDEFVLQEFKVSAHDRRIRHPEQVVIRRAEKFGKANPGLRFAGCRFSSNIQEYSLKVSYRRQPNALS